MTLHRATGQTIIFPDHRVVISVGKTNWTKAVLTIAAPISLSIRRGETADLDGWPHPWADTGERISRLTISRKVGQSIHLVEINTVVTLRTVCHRRCAINIEAPREINFFRGENIPSLEICEG